MSESEWDAIQRRFGNAAPAPAATLRPAVIPVSEESVVDLAVSTADAHAQQNAKDDKDDDDPFGLDEEDEKERAVLEQYRRARMAELRASTFGSVFTATASTFVSEITEASKSAWVVAMLWEEGTASEVLGSILVSLARKFPAVKFVRGMASQCMAKVPTGQLPILLCYHGGTVVKQFLGLASFGGVRATADDVEWALSKVGVLETDLTEPPIVTVPNRFTLNISKKPPIVSSA